MENRKLEIDYQVARFEELADGDRELVCRAMQATANSYARYSHFCVGAAVRLDDGTIVSGANQENAAFPSGLCAERTAVFAAQAQYPEHKITTLAIAASNGRGFVADPIVPCGACRQVILEVEDRYKSPVRMMLYGTRAVYIFHSISDLLPFSFVGDSMR